MTSDLLPCPRCEGTRFTAGGKCLLCFGVGRIADRRETDRRTRPVPAACPTSTDLARLAEAWVEASFERGAAAAKKTDDMEADAVRWCNAVARDESASAAFRAGLADLLASVERVLEPIGEAATSIGMEDRPADFHVPAYKVLDGDYHDYRSLRLEHLRAAADLLRRVKGG